MVIDAPHDVDDILAVVGDRKVKAILCTHAHDDHVRVAPALREEVVAPIMLHPDDRPLWELTHTDQLWDVDLADGVEIEVGGTDAAGAAHARPRAGRGLLPRARPRLRLHRRHPVPRAGRARPAGRSATSDLIVESIRARLFALPDETVVHTGHGDDTTIGAERAALDG